MIIIEVGDLAFEALRIYAEAFSPAAPLCRRGVRSTAVTTATVNGTAGSFNRNLRVLPVFLNLDGLPSYETDQKAFLS